MSRLGKKPVKIANDTSVVFDHGLLIVKGPKGELNHNFGDLVKIEIKGEEVFIDRTGDTGPERAIQGTAYALLRNMMTGVTEGFKKSLELIGVGFRVAKKDKGIELAIGFSHPVYFAVPEGVECTIEKNFIHLSGIDKQLVGEVAANIRKLKKPEPYKGKGIKYVDEKIRRKAGKAGKAGA
ncbi:50S ribosomal protein L6 [Candidatus Microgenomates bacterium]|nr:50S ribosomal protein L6 [Candidatus Microgenomates bacterium]